MNGPPRPGLASVWKARLLAIAVAIAATVAVVLTYPVLSQTFDEPLHLATGLEWLQYRSALLNTENPPIARSAVALGPFLTGARLPPLSEWDTRGPQRKNGFDLGNGVLFRDARYIANLTAARLGVLPFLWLTMLIVWLWAERRGQPAVGAIALVSGLLVPPILAHAGFATTDIPFVGTFLAALYATSRILDTPGYRQVAIAAALVAVAILTKFSTFVFFGPAVLGLLLAWAIELGPNGVSAQIRRVPWRGALAAAAVAIVTTGLVVWAGYGFSFGRIGDLQHHLGFGASIERNGVLPWWAEVPIPAPQLAHGFLSLRRTVAYGHRAYLFGEFSQTGFWDYYLVTVLVKSPLPFLLMALIGLAAAARCARRAGAWPFTGAALAALAMLAANITSPLNYGIRHVLVVYPLLALGAAWGWWQLIQSARRTVWATALGVLLVAQVALLPRAFPDYLPFFNTLAGSDPGRIVVETDLDWGQDLLRLDAYLKEKQVRRARLAYFGTALPCRLSDTEFLPLEPGVPATGWIAISEVYAREIFAIGLRKHPCDEQSTAADVDVRGKFAWLGRYQPVARIGAIRVYHIEQSAYRR